MTISATTQGLRQGVCTSSNRPSVPFQGQVIYETDTTLSKVWNGSAWIGYPVNVVPQTTVYGSGSGTYTVPSGTRWLSVRMVGGGGGGAAPFNTGATNGVGGTATTFGTGTANGGAAGQVNDGGGLGGTATIVTGASGIAISGGDGNPGDAPQGIGSYMSGSGGSSFFGGAGKGVGGSNYASGTAGKTNTGGGGGGGGGSNGGQVYTAGGGGAGGYVECIITSPAATYAYAVGAGGAGGNNGTVTGGTGGSGVIYVVAYF
jgi:hypothetical protein